METSENVGVAGAPGTPGYAPFLSLAIVGIVLLGAALRLYLIFSTHATEEDLYITLRYAQNLAHGMGMIYNAGERVLGTTTPLYTVALALAIRLHLDPVLTGKLMSVAADAGSCLLIWRLGLRLGAPRAALSAALCFALEPLNLTEGVKGMESSLVACACIAAWSLWAEDKSIGAWFSAALLTLLRIDGAIIALLLLGASLWRSRRLPVRGLLLYALLVGPWLAYATVVYGSPVPTSLRAKLIVYGWHNAALFPNIVPFVRIMVHNPINLIALLGLALLIWKIAGAFRDRQRGAPAAAVPEQASALLLAAPMIAWLLLYYGAMALSKVFLFGWYFLPPTPLFYLLGFAGLPLAGFPRAAEDPSNVDRRIVPGWFAIGLLAAGLLIAPVVVSRVGRSLRESQRAEDELRIPIGVWLREHAAPRDTVMLEPIGYIGYYSRLRMLDTVGLVSPEVLPYYRQDEPSPHHAIWRTFRPEWVLLRAGEWEELRRYEAALPASERLDRTYRLERTWLSPGSPVGSGPAFLLFRRAGSTDNSL